MKTAILSFVAILLCITLKAADFTPFDLRCEYQVNPIAIGSKAPRFFWKIPSPLRGTVQTAYQLLVSTDSISLKPGNGETWNSGKISSSANVQIPYDGIKLLSCTKYYWKVKIWVNKSSQAFESKIYSFETAFLEQTGWTAKWISGNTSLPIKDEDFYKVAPAPVFVKKFRVTGKIKNARLYISGLGYYDAQINSKPVTADVLAPGWTGYKNTIQYNVYDISSQLKAGNNSISITAGNGWYNPLPLKMWGILNLRKHLQTGVPKIIAELHIEYINGKKEKIITDENWELHYSNILKNSIYLGETWDANKKPAPAGRAILATPPGGNLEVQYQEPIRVTKIFKPINIKEPLKDVYIFDMGNNFAGWLRAKIHGPKGNKVRFRYGELLHADGTLNGLTAVAGQIKESSKINGGPGAPQTAWQEDTYILRGAGEEYFQPKFTFHGFRYVEISGLGYKPPLNDIEGLRLNADVTEDGEFSCSSDLFNNIQKMVTNTFLSNIFSVQSDCPTREKFGYGGDIVATADAFMYNYNMARFYSKTLQDYEDAARPQGGMTETAPFNGIADMGLGDSTGPIAWQLVFPFLQKKLYDFYGDKRIIEKYYPSTVKLIEFIKSKAKDHIIDTCIGDHESIAPKQVAVSSTAFYYYMVKLLSEFALILDKPQDQQEYLRLSADIRQAFIKRFCKENGEVGIGTQANQAFGIWTGIIPQEIITKSLIILSQDILEKNNDHLSTGIFGTKMLFDVLENYDLNNIAYTIASQKTSPGWGYMLDNGATTLWEHWEKEDTIYSHNHPMFGSVSEWFYKSLGGIQQQEGSVGFTKIVIKPVINNELQWAKASYNSLLGKIKSGWERDNDTINITISVPGNSSAKIYLPVLKKDIIQEGNIVIWNNGYIKNDDIQFLEKTGNWIVFNIGSGNYTFKVH